MINLSFKSLVYYSLPMTAGGMMSILVINYLMKYSTDILFISPGIMGLIFFISRLWDAVNDPICGYLSDHTKSPYGRRKIWIRISIIPIALFFYMLWTVPEFENQNWIYIWMAFSVIAFFTVLTALYVPHYSLGAELSTSYHQRNRIYGFRAIAENIGNFLGIGVMTAMSLAANPKEQAQWLILLVSLVSIFFVLLMTRNVEEKTNIDYPLRSKMIPSFIDVFKNPHARIILFVGFASQLGAAIVMGMALYFAEYIIIKPEMGTLFMGIFMLSATLSIPLWLKLSKGFSKKGLWITAKLFLGIGFTGTFFLGKGDHNLLLILCLPLGFAAGAVLIVHPSMLADCIDYDQFKTNERKEGVYFSVFTFINKSAMGLSAVIIGFTLEFSGFKPNLVQTEFTKTAIRSVYAFVPMVCFLTGAFILSWYKLNEKQHKFIQSQIN